MRYIIFITLSFFLSACSLYGPKRAPEVVASCFSDGEDQGRMCKSQRVNEENKIVITRCIGTQNREANPALRGKCVEKICSEGSNTDCLVKGEMRVLEQYSDLVTSNMFGDGDSPAAPATATATATTTSAGTTTSAPVAATAKKAPPVKEKKPTHKATAKGPVEIDIDPSAVLPPLPEKKPVVVATPKPVMQKFTSEEAAAPQMSISLKPAKPAKVAKKKARAVAGAKGEVAFKRVCVPKNDSEAPESLRGKCATRSCNSGKCSYKGRKEMFDYFARASNEE